MTPVVVFGATGYQGRLVTAKLVRSKIPITVVGRDPDKLEKLVSGYKTRIPYKVARAEDFESICKVLVRGTKVLVNCVGPYLFHGDNVVRAALERKVNYLDVTGELYFMRETHWRHDALAREKKVVVVNSMAFEYALGDFCARRLAERMGEKIKLMEIFYYIPTFQPSAGTRRSMLAAMDKPVYGFEGGKLVEIKAGTFRKNLHLSGHDKPLSALSFPGGEVFTVPRHVGLRTLREYMVMSISAARLLYGSSPKVIRASSKARAAEEALLNDGPSRPQREKNKFQIILEGGDEGGSRVLVCSGKDVYGLTASIVLFGVKEILQQRTLGAGVLSPVRAFDERRFWNAMGRAGVKTRFNRGVFSS